METLLQGGLRGSPLNSQDEEEVSAFSTVITYKQQLEEMYAALSQVNGDLPHDVLLEGEETYNGWDDELYELISLRQRDAIDRARAIAVFYDCLEMLQQVKDMFAGLLARRHAGGLPGNYETRTASATSTSDSLITSSISPILAALPSTAGTSLVVGTVSLSIASIAVTASLTASTTTLSSKVTTVSAMATQLESTTAMLLTTTSMEEASSNDPGCFWQREMFAQGHAPRGLEEGLPLYVELADLKLGGCKTLEEGQGFGGFYKNGDADFGNGFWASSFIAGDAARNDDALQDKNNNNCDAGCVDLIGSNNQIAADIRGPVSVICLAFILPSFGTVVGFDWGWGREGWGVVWFANWKAKRGGGKWGGGVKGWDRDGLHVFFLGWVCGLRRPGS
ncbi:hypothetical protein CBR_g18764 [Chara braunii]|uniref:Uncharacterized protein n=1 Tax=Chara braunii TaxID=69332 RepID=A0A388KWL7_CHABU|nr:hypothetical protein CBR_g18764 [Chara braunii]|eukprot:GBG74353.1 hypothetical protein CBR_g18764 [Chara braunii]